MKTSLFNKLASLTLGIFLLILPFVNASHFNDGIEMGKIFAFIYFSFILSIILSLKYTIVRYTTLTVVWVDVAVFFYCLIEMIYMTIRIPAIYTSIYFFQHLALSLLYVLIRVTESKGLLIFIVVSGGLQAVYGILQLYGVYPSHHNLFLVTGGFYNPGPYSGFIMVAFVLGLGFYFIQKTNKTDVFHLQTTRIFFNSRFEPYIVGSMNFIKKWGLLLVLLSMLLILPATHSRASWLGVFIGIAYYLKIEIIPFSMPRMHIPIKKTYRWAILLIGIIVLLGGIYFLKKDSADGRMLIWSTSLLMIVDQPLFGHGYGGFLANYMDYQAIFFNSHPNSSFGILADNVQYPYNFIIKTLVEYGLVGLVAISLVFVSLFFLKPRKYTQHYGLTKGALLSIMVFGMFSYPEQIILLKIVVVALVAILANSGKGIWEYRWRHNFITMSLLALGAYCVFSIREIDKCYRQWNQANNLYAMTRYKECNAIYKACYPSFINNGFFLLNYGKSLAMDKNYSEGVKVLLKSNIYISNSILHNTLGDCFLNLKQVKKAESAYMHAADMLPDRFYSKYLLAKLYVESGDSIKAKHLADELLTKSVKIESMAVRQIKQEMKNIINNNGKKQEQPHSQKL